MITKRNIWLVIFLIIVTGGLYMAYWFIKTKFELNKSGAQIPTGFLFFVPLVNFYFIYKFAQAFAAKVIHDKTQYISYFFLFALLMPVGVVLGQAKINGK